MSVLTPSRSKHSPCDYRRAPLLMCVIATPRSLMSNPLFEQQLASLARGLPDLERLCSRVHGGSCTVKNFRLVLKAFRKCAEALAALQEISTNFKGSLVQRLLQQTPNLPDALDKVEAMFTGDGSTLIPHEGHDDTHDEALSEVRAAEEALDAELEAAKTLLKCALHTA